MHPFTVAVVGAAGWAGRRHLNAFDAVGARIAAVVDPDPATADLARRYGAAVLTLRGLADRTDLDLAVVSLPCTVQPAVCADLVEHGLPVLVEKPVAPTRAQAAPLTEAGLDLSGVMVGFTLHHHPAVRWLRGWLGGRDLVAVSARSVAHKQRLDSWRGDPSEGGVSLVNGIHALELVPTLLGSTATVEHAVADDATYRAGVADHVMATLRLSDGTPFRLETAWQPWHEDDGLNDGDWDLSIEFLTAQGRAVWSAWLVDCWERDGTRHRVSWQPVDLFTAQAAAVVQAVRHNGRMTGVEEALVATDLAAAINDAAGGCAAVVDGNRREDS